MSKIDATFQVPMGPLNADAHWNVLAIVATAATFHLPHARNVRALVMQWAKAPPADMVSALKRM